MGFNVVSLEVSARLSSHNNERDERDGELWTELRRKIEALTQEPRYADISASVF